jgi:flagellar biosynthesis/type III secretory pathway M-ring protein FliF/YscJ
VLPGTVTNNRRSPIEQLKGNPKMMGIAAGAVAVVLAGVGFIFMRMKKSSAARAVQVAQSLPAAAESPQELARASAPAQDAWAPSIAASNKISALAPARLETLTQELRATAQKDAEICAGVLRGWLKEGQA